MLVEQIIEFIITVLSCSFANQTTSLSSLCTPIWRYWTFKNACQVCTFSNVCLRLTQFSQLSFMQYIGHCVFSLPSYDDCEKMCIVRKRAFHRVIIIKSEAWPIYHCLGLGHGIMVCAVCLFIFLWTHICVNGNYFGKILMSLCADNL